MTHRSALLFALSLPFAISGCRQQTPGANPHPAAEAARHPAAPVNPATAGSITGKVLFKGAAPKRIAIDMSADPACALAAEPNLTESIVAEHGRLANVYVYIKAGLPSSDAPAGAPAVVVDQKGCRYTPHVVALQQGGTVEFRNSDPTMHNVHTMPAQAGNQSLDLSETPNGAAQSESFSTAESMIPVRCNNHPWMQAFLNVAPNPYFAVTGADGSFTLRDLPPGTYTLAAVQEKLGEQDIQVTVAPRATAEASFTFSSRQP